MAINPAAPVPICDRQDACIINTECYWVWGLKENDIPAHRGERPMCLPRGVFHGCNWVVWPGRAEVLPSLTQTARAGSPLARH